MKWVEENLASLRAEHLVGIQNVSSDELSRQTIQEAEWQLKPKVFQAMTKKFNQPVMDLFASSRNRQMGRFFARAPDPEADKVGQWP